MDLHRRLHTIQSFLRQRHNALKFDAVPDPRNARGVRWSVQALLSTAVLGLLMLARSLRKAEKFSEDLAWAQRSRGIKRRVPDSTLGDFLSRLKPQALREHLHRHILQEHRRKALEPEVLPIRAIAIDGKTVAMLDEAVNADCQDQSPAGGPSRFAYRVMNTALISASAAACIDQKPIPSATNETGIFGELFEELEEAYGKAHIYDLISTDAGLASERNARQIDEAGKFYWICLKGNQPELQAEAWRLLRPVVEQSEPEAQTDWERDSSRGWIRRELWRSPELPGLGAWSHLCQVVLVRVLKAPGRLSGKAPFQGPIQILEERLYVTNLRRDRLGAGGMLSLCRAHWRIENELHGSLDIQWQEDHGRWVRRGNGLPVVGLLRALAYNLLVLLRSVHLRTSKARSASWQQLRDWMRDALIQRCQVDGQEGEVSTATL